MNLNLAAAALILAFSSPAFAKVFQNSYVSFEVPDNWTCAQEGVAWTCTPQGPAEAKEAVIVLAAKVAGPEDNLGNFLAYLKQPKKVTTKVGTPMPSQVMYAQERVLATTKWVQAQHLSSEIHDFYTLYLATVKEQLAILVSFSAEKSRYQAYNPVFDRAIKTLKIVANQQLLFPKTKGSPTSEVIGISPGNLVNDDLIPVPAPRKSGGMMILAFLAIVVAGLAFFLLKKKGGKKSSSGKSPKPSKKP